MSASEDVFAHKQEVDKAAPGVSTPWYTTNITPKWGTSVFRITVALATASVFNVVVRDPNATTPTDRVLGLNASAALAAGDVYTFTMGCSSKFQYNFQVETDSIIRTFILDEIINGTI